jgi:RNA polymerase sigma factor (sigma-70 family)
MIHRGRCMGRSDPRDRAARRRADSRDDPRLARLAAAGDGSAFWELAEAHYDAVYRLARALLGDGPQAQDAAQEAVLRAHEGTGRYDPERAFGPWLRGIAVNVCREHMRRRGRRRAAEASLADVAEVPVGAEHQDPPDRVLQALMELEETYRVPLALFYIEDATVGEVAEALGLSEGAVRVRLHRGREKLREIITRERTGEADS